MIVSRRLPDGDGLDVITAIRRRHQDVPALLILEREDLAARRRAAVLGALVHDEPVDPIVVENLAVAAIRAHARRFDVQHVLVLDRWSREGLLTNTEREVVRLKCLGLRPEEIVSAMTIAISTYQKHVQNILAKTGDVGIDEVVRRVLLETAGGTPLPRASHAAAANRRKGRAR